MNETMLKIAKHLGEWLSIVALLLALLMLMGAQFIPYTSLWHHTVRDLGIGFLVAALVGAIFELQMRGKTIKDVLENTMGILLDDEVWNEARSQVLFREKIRKNAYIRLSIEPIASCPGMAIFQLKFEYELCGLYLQSREVPLVHELDDFLKHGEYPRFRFIQVGKDRYEGERLQSNVVGGRFATKVELPGKNGESISVISVREEVVYLPGSYTLTMTDLTQGVTLALDKLPDEIEAEVTLRPHTQVPIRLRTDQVPEVEFKTTMLLPGQGVEFRFRAKAEPAQAIRPVAPTAIAAA